MSQPPPPFVYSRTIRFADTDAAGVVFFARYLSICHEAYEEALGNAGIELKRFFSDERVIIPIAKAEAHYLRPLQAGDRITIAATPTALSDASFEIRFEMARAEPPQKRVAAVRTEHVCLDATNRSRVPLPPGLARWVGKPASIS